MARGAMVELVVHFVSLYQVLIDSLGVAILR